ncbi:ABC transporter ATP-binding protein [Rhodoligotrophos defluvii]|uniref:ABC transporter ATP-binding protein n=1 Tax=Rhodoligotrophos defluvii TaxID=2561934 RepID=UPI0010C99F42|nr:ABC transporter ATP-binding protein [Rhodoligotrophos defluvii]
MKIEAKAVGVRLGSRQILSDVDLAVSPGEMIGLVGPNGAGKSTLLAVLAGLCAPDSGRVIFDGCDANSIGPRQLARRLSFLAQSASIEWRLNVEQVVALGRLPHRGLWGPQDPASDARAIAAAMRMTEVETLAKRPLNALSGGERMRVLLARALAVEGEVLLADEPIAGLDPYHQLRAMELLAAAASAGTAVVVVLHELTLAARFCRRLVLMSQGRLVADGTPEAVLSPGLLEAVYSVLPLVGTQDGERFILPWRRNPSMHGDSA